jgi:ATP:corrinoid adenosyltransferase
MAPRDQTINSATLTTPTDLRPENADLATLLSMLIVFTGKGKSSAAFGMAQHALEQKIIKSGHVYSLLK